MFTSRKGSGLIALAFATLTNGGCYNLEEISSKRCKSGTTYWKLDEQACVPYKNLGDECNELIYDEASPPYAMCGYPESPTTRFGTTKPAIVPWALQTAQQMGNCTLSPLKLIGGDTYATTNLPVTLPRDTVAKVYLGEKRQKEELDDRGFVIKVTYTVETTHVMLTCDAYTDGKQWFFFGMNLASGLPEPIREAAIIPGGMGNPDIVLYKDYTGSPNVPMINGQPQRGYLMRLIDL